METEVRRSRQQQLVLQRVENGWEAEFEVFVGDHLPNYDPSQYHNGKNWRTRSRVFVNETELTSFANRYFTTDPAKLAAETELGGGSSAVEAA